MKPQRGVDIQLYSFLNLVARWGGFPTPRLGRFTHGKDQVPIVQEAPGPVWTALMEERRGVYRVLVGKPEEKRPLRRPRRRLEDHNKMYLQELGCGCVGWIEVAQDRDNWRALVNAVMNLRFSIRCGDFLD
jgi:hypothetical protein